jgi:hypothetical protein
MRFYRGINTEVEQGGQLESLILSTGVNVPSR